MSLTALTFSDEVLERDLERETFSLNNNIKKKLKVSVMIAFFVLSSFICLVLNDKYLKGDS